VTLQSAGKAAPSATETGGVAGRADAGGSEADAAAPDRTAGEEVVVVEAVVLEEVAEDEDDEDDDDDAAAAVAAADAAEGAGAAAEADDDGDDDDKDDRAVAADGGDGEDGASRVAAGAGAPPGRGRPPGSSGAAAGSSSSKASRCFEAPAPLAAGEAARASLSLRWPPQPVSASAALHATTRAVVVTALDLLVLRYAAPRLAARVRSRASLARSRWGPPRPSPALHTSMKLCSSVRYDMWR
jgi:hypothetical protein